MLTDLQAFFEGYCIWDLVIYHLLLRVIVPTQTGTTDAPSIDDPALLGDFERIERFLALLLFIVDSGCQQKIAKPNLCFWVAITRPVLLFMVAGMSHSGRE